MAAYDEIVGLGNHCRVAYNLRRTFGIARAFPFDWWITPVQSLVAFLEDPSLDKLYDPGRLAPVMREGKIFAVDNIHYGIQLQHEFPRWKNGSVVAGWSEHIDQARERTEFLWNRLLATPPERRILFVRWFAAGERKRLKGDARPTVSAIQAGLARLFPATSFELLLVDPPEWIEAPGVSSLQVGDPGRGWRGTPELWTQALLGHGITWTGAPSTAAPDPQADQRAYA